MKKLRFSIVMALALTLIVAIFAPFSATKAVKADGATVLTPIDVYMLLGQSNAAGHTKINNTSKSAQENQQNLALLQETFSNVLMGGVSEPDSNTGTVNPNSSQGYTRLTYASLGPVHAGLGRNDNCVGPEYGMAKVLNSKYSSTNKAIIFKYAKGSTALANVSDAEGVWLSPSLSNDNSAYNSVQYKMYPRMIASFKSFCTDLKQNGFQPVVKGIAWHQGEDDRGNIEAYRTAIKAFVQDLRADITEATGVDGSSVFFALGEISPTFGADASAYTGKNANFIKMCREVVCEEEMMPAATINADDLLIHTTDGSVNLGSDQWHFSVPDIIKMGERFANSFSAYAGKNHAKISVTGNGSCGIDKIYFDEGEQITFSVAPDKNNLLVSFKINGVDKTAELNEGKYTMTATAGITATVEFREKAYYTFTIQGRYNMAKTKTTRNAYEGELIYVTPAPEEGQEVASVTFNGEEMAYNATTKRYERENASCDGTIVITYQAVGENTQTPPADEEKSGCGKEAVGLALATFATLIACAFIIKK